MTIAERAAASVSDAERAAKHWRKHRWYYKDRTVEEFRAELEKPLENSGA